MDGACGAYGDRIGVFRALVRKREEKRPLGCSAYNHTANSSNNNNTLIKITHSMEQSTSEANRLTSTQEIPSISWKPKAH